MKALYGMGVLGLSLFMAGCFSGEPAPQEKGEIAQMCSEPRYTIVFGKIDAKKENILSKKEFQVILDESLAQSGCFKIEPKASADTSYTLNIKYGFEIDEVKENTSMVSSKDSATLKSDISFTLVNKTKTIQQNATNTLKLSEKKYLGVGDELEITQEQKKDVMQRSLKTIFNNLSTMPND